MTQTGLVRLLSYEFKNTDLFTQALTHRSFSAANNERLEFLGDGVLNLIIAHQLYQRYPKHAEGDLSRMRANLVKESTLCEIALSLDIGGALKLGEGELRSGGWRRPSVLADAFEAIIGAVFLDGGLEPAQALVSRLFRDRLDKIDPQSNGKDAKSLLQEHLQSKKMELPNYVVTATEGEAHCQVFKVECRIEKLKIVTTGEGNSRRVAEQQAAESAYEIIMKGVK